MRIEVLLSTMFQKNFEIVKKCNLKTDAIIINQCDKQEIREKEYSFGKVKMISINERGLSKSRNMALKNSTADICILADDDIVFHDNYPILIEKTFSEILDADVIVFNIISKNVEKRSQEKLFKKIKKIPFYKSYSSVHIAFKRKSIQNNNINFDINFGSGSGKYSFAEDSLFFSEIHKHGLKSYVYPAIIADLYTYESTWFTGFNKKYFYDTGAFLAAGYPILNKIYKWYYPIKLYKKSTLSFFEIIKYIDLGIDGFSEGKKYDDKIQEVSNNDIYKKK